eukprot:CAMPEP_0195107416 /NCGR_PEP_ID=MMETSP0448-20130528/82071_1 /TAXON_ID=66468 /ORGANISM="Heterocapsa triquestra, Strain CCMP 448" /LENGTH=67 /DNA_ID=CAMNT_0040143851 /DNA_START=44 /DNA_END=245 /DNA_ORIENTATION=+
MQQASIAALLAEQLVHHLMRMAMGNEDAVAHMATPLHGYPEGNWLVKAQKWPGLRQEPGWFTAAGCR